MTVPPADQLPVSEDGLDHGARHVVLDHGAAQGRVIGELGLIADDHGRFSCAPDAEEEALHRGDRGGEAVPGERDLGRHGERVEGLAQAVELLERLGLKEAKAVVDGAPGPVKEGATKDEAEDIKKQIEEAGGAAELK